MSRSFVIPGDSLVYVKGTLDVQGYDFQLGSLWELGLASDEIKISINPAHQDVKVDDFGTQIPVDVRAELADAFISMNLIHYDEDVLEACISESMGGRAKQQPANTRLGYSFPGAGRPLGGGRQLFSSGNHHITLYIRSITPSDLLSIEDSTDTYRFLACHLVKSIEVPRGNNKSIVNAKWRAIPYTELISGSTNITIYNPGGNSGNTLALEICSSGTVLYDKHFPDWDLTRNETPQIT